MIKDKMDTLMGILVIVMIVMSMRYGCTNRKSLERIEQIIAPTNIVEVIDAN